MRKLFRIFLIVLCLSLPSSVRGEAFSSEPVGEGLRLLGCSGDDESISVPAEIGGIPVTAIGTGAFAEVKADSISLPGSVAVIEEGAFRGCTLREIRFSSGLTEIGKEAFADCTALVGAALPESVQCIGDRAFAGCTSLLYVTLPKNVNIPEGDPFSGCSRLASLPMPAGQPYLELTGAELRSRMDGRLISTLPALLPAEEETKP